MPYELKNEDDLARLERTRPELSGVSEVRKFRSMHDVPRLGDCHGRAINYLEEPLLAEGAITAFTGGAGCGKSSLVCAILRRVHATGRPVAILDRENPLPVIEDRFRRLKMSDDENFIVWGGWVGEEAPPPAAALVLEWVVECLARISHR